MMGKEVTCIDKDGEEFAEYSLYFKQYMTDVTDFNADLVKCYSIIIGQCNPSMGQALTGEKRAQKYQGNFQNHWPDQNDRDNLL